MHLGETLRGGIEGGYNEEGEQQSQKERAARDDVGTNNGGGERELTGEQSKEGTRLIFIVSFFIFR